MQQFTITAGAFSLTAYDEPGAVGSTFIREVRAPAAELRRRTAPGQYGDAPIGEAQYGSKAWTFRLERERALGDDGADSEAWLQGLQELAAAASRVGDARMEVLASGGDVITWEVLQCTVEPVNYLSVPWHGGVASAEMTVTTAAVGLGAPVVMVAALPAPTRGVTYWESAGVVPGDVPALVDVSAEWATQVDRQAVVQTGPHTIVRGIDLPRLGAGWGTTTTVAGTSNATAASGPVMLREAERVAALPLTSTERAWGAANIAVRAAVTSLPSGLLGGVWATWELRHNGVAVSRVRALVGEGGLGQFRPWRLLRFGSAPTSGDLTLWVYVEKGFGTWLGAIDYVVMQRARDRAALFEAEPEQAEPPVVREDFSGGSTTLNGRTVDFGAVAWAASGSWNVDTEAGFASTEAGEAYLPGAAGHRRFAVSVALAGDTPLASATVAMANGPSLADRHVRLELLRTDGDLVVARPHLRGAAPSIPIGAGAIVGEVGAPVVVDVEITVDVDGRWVVRITSTTGTVQWAGHASDLATGAAGNLRPLLVASGLPLFQRVRVGSISSPSLGVAYSSTARPITDAVAYGDVITAEPGEPCRGVVMAADTDVDAPPSPRPTSLSVSVTPRWLGVPD